MSLTASQHRLKSRPDAKSGPNQLSGCSSAVEHHVANVRVVSSILITRSNFQKAPSNGAFFYWPAVLSAFPAPDRISGKADQDFFSDATENAGPKPRASQTRIQPDLLNCIVGVYAAVAEVVIGSLFTNIVRRVLEVRPKLVAIHRGVPALRQSADARDRWR